MSQGIWRPPYHRRSHSIGRQRIASRIMICSKRGDIRISAYRRPSFWEQVRNTEYVAGRRRVRKPWQRKEWQSPREAHAPGGPRQSPGSRAQRMLSEYRLRGLARCHGEQSHQTLCSGDVEGGTGDGVTADNDRRGFSILLTGNRFAAHKAAREKAPTEQIANGPENRRYCSYECRRRNIMLSDVARGPAVMAPDARTLAQITSSPASCCPSSFNECSPGQASVISSGQVASGGGSLNSSTMPS